MKTSHWFASERIRHLLVLSPQNFDIIWRHMTPYCDITSLIIIIIIITLSVLKGEHCADTSALDHSVWGVSWWRPSAAWVGQSQGRLNTDVPALPLIITHRLGGTHFTWSSRCRLSRPSRGSNSRPFGWVARSCAMCPDALSTAPPRPYHRPCYSDWTRHLSIVLLPHMKKCEMSCDLMLCHIMAWCDIMTWPCDVTWCHNVILLVRVKY